MPSSSSLKHLCSETQRKAYYERDFTLPDDGKGLLRQCREEYGVHYRYISLVKVSRYDYSSDRMLGAGLRLLASSCAACESGRGWQIVRMRRVAQCVRFGTRSSQLATAMIQAAGEEQPLMQAATEDFGKRRSWRLHRTWHYDCVPCMPARYVVVALCSLGLANMFLLRVNLSVAIVQMDRSTVTLTNQSARVSATWRGNYSARDFAWSSEREFRK